MSAISKVLFLSTYSYQEFKNCAKSIFLKIFHGLKETVSLPAFCTSALFCSLIYYIQGNKKLGWFGFFRYFCIFPASLMTTQLTFTCSKSTMETLEKGVKYVQSQQIETGTIFWYIYCRFWTYFTPFSSVSNFEQINVCWAFFLGMYFFLNVLLAVMYNQFKGSFSVSLFF